MNHREQGYTATSLATLIATVAALLVATFYVGVFYEGKRIATRQHAELQDTQRRTSLATTWLRNQHAIQTQQQTTLVAQLRSQLDTEQGTANASHHTHAAAVRSGAVSVRVPVILPARCESAGSTAAPASSTGPAKTYAQLDPAAAADLADISHDGDKAIRELNYCIDRYAQLQQNWAAWQRHLAVLESSHAQTN
ncbi:hypothetical protein KUF54_03210 [Comamonas sp. Y33R10-2]|uniref:hypothetical protein n=1 Tax=Comamonas sp. Y33R10-2 TaxID=2853257 RepID=UPI001C5C9746|nr:hypothetical protein [Comamonas sp. Y33R10-2]QXZ10277.1 hypothetical protein KUF54_03210 [Comamonas sp. Y33R10-2]